MAPSILGNANANLAIPVSNAFLPPPITNFIILENGVGADGRIGLCCLDHELSEQVGDVKSNSIEEIWQGDVINSYRTKMLNLDYSSIGSCANCNAHTFQSNKTWAKLQKN